MDLYTIVADYRGLRAVGQRQGASPRGALKSWLRPYRLGGLGLNKRTQSRVRKELLEFKQVGPERIQAAGIQNVWRIAALPRCELLVHIIKTRK
jgi:hypothetical protein